MERQRDGGSTVATLGRGAAEALRGGELRGRHDRSGAARRPCGPARASARRLPRPTSSGDRRGAQQRRLHDDVDRAVADPVPSGGRARAPDVGDGGSRNARAACFAGEEAAGLRRCRRRRLSPDHGEPCAGGRHRAGRVREGGPGRALRPARRCRGRRGAGGRGRWGRRPRARPAQYGQRSDRDTNGDRGAAADRSSGSVPGR